MATIRVYLLDDHEIVRRGLRDLLETEGGMVVVGEAGTVEEAVRSLPDLAPDVAVIDGRLPDGTAVDVCRAIRSTAPETKALVLSGDDNEEALFAAILGGASGYLLKRIGSAALLNSVRQVAAGQSVIDPALTGKVVDRVSPAPGGAPGAAPVELAALSRRERDILGLIAEGMTNRQIGERLDLAEKTVKNNVSGLLTKLKLERRTQAAVLAARLLGG